MRLRPEGSRGPLCVSFDGALSYYDTKGRTWERQAYVKARPIAGDRELGERIARTARSLDLSPLLESHGHRRHQIAQAADRASRRERRGRSAQRKDRPRRHPRRRVRDSVPAIAQWRRAPRGSHRQHARSDRPPGAVRLPDPPRAVDPRRQLQLPAEAGASAANHVRSADAPAARRSATSWQSSPCGWATRARRIARRWWRSRRITRIGPPSTARFSITCCTTRFPATGRSSRKSTW